MDAEVRYPLPVPALVGVPALRARTLVWREECRLVFAGPRGAHIVEVEWPIERHQLSPDGRYVLALGDDGKRAAIRATEGGRRILDLVGNPAQRQSLRAGLAPVG